MSWIDILENKEGIVSIYGDETPSLSAVSLHGLALNRDAASVRIKFDLLRFPANPPKKWSQNAANTVQLELYITGINTVEINGWTTTMEVDITIAPLPEGGFELTCGALPEIKLTAQAVYISRISAYHDTLRE